MKRTLLVILLVSLFMVSLPVQAQTEKDLMILAYCDYNANGIMDGKDKLAANKIILVTPVAQIGELNFTPGKWVEFKSNTAGMVVLSGLWEKISTPIIVAQVSPVKAKRLLDTQMLFVVDYETPYADMPLQTCVNG